MSEDKEGVRRELEERSTDELVRILRNRDEGEWQPEVFDVVASILTTRGIAPSDVIALGPEGIDVVEEQPLVTIGRYFNPVEAHGHRMALEEANLRAWVTDESGGAMFGVGVGTRLQVRVEDEAAARAVLEGAAVPASTPPPELAEAACPKCGSPGVEQEAAQPGHASRYECSSCRHSWSE